MVAELEATNQTDLDSCADIYGLFSDAACLTYIVGCFQPLVFVWKLMKLHCGLETVLEGQINVIQKTNR